MNERERLIELINQAQAKSDDNFGMTNSEQMADFLLENGVVLLPCKIGDYCKISKCITADNNGEGDIKIRYSVMEIAQLIGIACVTVNESGTKIMDIENVFAIKESEDNG